MTISVTPALILRGMDQWGETRTVDEQVGAWQEEILQVECDITRLRARQVELIRRLDRFQVDTADGAGRWAIGFRPGLICPVRPRAGSPSRVHHRPRRPTHRKRLIKKHSTGPPGVWRLASLFRLPPSAFLLPPAARTSDPESRL